MVPYAPQGGPCCLSTYTSFSLLIANSQPITSLPSMCLVAQSFPTVCDPMDCSPPGSSVHGILQAGILEWVTVPSSRGSSPPRDGTQVSCIAGGIFFFFLPSEPPGKPLPSAHRQPRICHLCESVSQISSFVSYFSFHI